MGETGGGGRGAKGGGGRGAKGGGGRKPKMTSREIDEKYIKQGMELGRYIMGERDTLPLLRGMLDGKGGIKASALQMIEASRAANAPASVLAGDRARGSVLIDASGVSSAALKGFNTGGRKRRRADGPD